jgi:hypothetical protein
MIEPTFWLPQVAFPVIAYALHMFNYAFCIIDATESIRDPFTKIFFPDLWIGEAPATIIPILYSGTDIDGMDIVVVNNKKLANTGHFSAPLSDPDSILNLQRDMKFQNGTTKER